LRILPESFGLLPFALIPLLVGCHGSMSKIEALRDAWQSGDRKEASQVVEVPLCPEPPAAVSMTTCLSAAARAFGSPGFATDPPDQGSAAAVAFVLARRQSGEQIPEPDTWFRAIAGARGAGADALRLGLATAMAEASPHVGKAIDDEPSARAMLSAVATAIPGACGTYGALGRGAALESFAPAESPDHSACVQRDLARKDGPGGAYGDGLWRAAAAGATLWKEATTALQIGIAITEGSERRVLRKKLDALEAATKALNVRVVTTTQTGQYQATGNGSHEAQAIPSGRPPPGPLPSAIPNAARSPASSASAAAKLPPSP
jgi:hypothetical protein